MGYTKLHSTILDSSVWLEPAHVRLVWITMLAMADQHGVVHASVGGLAHRARVSKEEAHDAIARFLGPDPDSRDRTTGERIEEVPGGWLVLNHANYRDKQTREQALTAERVARHRERARTVTERYVTPGNGPLLMPMHSGASSSPAHGSNGSSTDVEQPLPGTANGAGSASPPIAGATPPRSSNSEAPRAAKREAGTLPPCPDDVPGDLWQEWVDFRKTKRAPVTQRVLDATRRTATDASMTMAEALTYWIANGQTGFFPQKSGKGNQRKSGGQEWRDRNEGWNQPPIDVPILNDIPYDET